jgi:hypothetical protein
VNPGRDKGFSSSVERPEREGNYSPPSNAEVNDWSYTSTPSVCLQACTGKNLSSYLLLSTCAKY